jgi:CDP-glucose 4,6-dehydratase
MEVLGMNQEFWKGKKVLLTGHTGFKGGWLAMWLQSAGAEVIGVSLAPTGDKNLYIAANLSDSMESHTTDIRNADQLNKVFSAAEPEIVLHLAAQALVRDSYDSPIETYSTNVMGSLNVLEACRSCSTVQSILIVTTDKCYQNREWLWRYREIDRLGGHDPYSSSKACLELMVESYRNSFFSSSDAPNLVTARAGNVIGGGDWSKDRLIPDAIRAIISNDKLQIRNPNAIRPWQHVLEPLNGYLKLVEKVHGDSSYLGSWNFGPDEQGEKSVAEIVNLLFKKWGGNAVDKWAVDENESVHEAGILKLDSTKARTNLSWVPNWNLETSIESIVQWHQQELAGTNMKEFSLQQIRDFQNGK